MTDTPTGVRASAGRTWHGQYMVVRELPCTSCTTVTIFERPPCADKHGADCPEWLCTGCGDAVLIGSWSLPARLATPRRRTVARAA
jgi:hypothetical protein